MDQEYAQLVRELFEPQHYPDLGDDTPYDAAGWTLPYQMNVNVVEGQAPLPDDFRAAMKAVQGKPVDWHVAADEPFTTNAEAAGIVPAPGGITGSGDQLVLDPTQNASFQLINRALAQGATLRFAPATGAGTAGKYIVAGVDPAKADAWAKELYVRAERGAASSASPSVAVPTRIAVYKSAPGVMDEGWTEWLFDTNGFKYSLITPADVRSGNLTSRFDVIVFASQGLGAGGGRGGRGGGGRGSGGGRGAAPDSAAAEEIHAVDEFVRGGGTIVAWNQGATSIINALRLPVRNVVAGLPRREFFTGGSVMQVITDPTHPIMAGMPERANVFVFNSPVFTTLDGFDGAVLAKFPADSSPLRSGFLSGQQFIQGFAAAVDVKHDRGHAVLFAFQPQWRGQPTGTFRTVFNSAFFGRDVADQAKGAAGFWTAPAMPVRADSTTGRGGRGRGGPPGAGR
jgi:hypothetical protein